MAHERFVDERFEKREIGRTENRLGSFDRKPSAKNRGARERELLLRRQKLP